MPEISEEQFHLLAEIQMLARVMKRCSNIREPEFVQAQAALAVLLNRLASLPSVHGRPGSIIV